MKYNDETWAEHDARVKEAGKTQIWQFIAVMLVALLAGAWGIL